MNEGTEYEVFHPRTGLIQPIRVTTYAEAQNVASELTRMMGGWEIRPIETGKEPIPPLAAIASNITVHEARQLMAQHGQNVLVILAFSERTGQCNIVTAGSNRQFSEQALELANDIAQGLKLNEGEKIEDRRDEHKS